MVSDAVPKFASCRSGMLALLGVGHAYLLSGARPRATPRRCSVVAADAACDVIVVGAGVPKRGMGWYHAKQILEGDAPSAALSAVVEPWFLGPGADSAAGATFAAWAEATQLSGVLFCRDVKEVPPPDGPRYVDCGSNHRLADQPTLRLTSRPAHPATHASEHGPTVEQHGAHLWAQCMHYVCTM